MERQQLPNATATLILGILSIPSCMCYGIGIIMSIVALVISKNAVILNAANPDMYVGIGNIKAGRICAIIGLILNILTVALMIGMFAWLGTDPEQWEHILQDKFEQ